MLFPRLRTLSGEGFSESPSDEMAFEYLHQDHTQQEEDEYGEYGGPVRGNSDSNVWGGSQPSGSVWVFGVYTVHIVYVACACVVMCCSMHYTGAYAACNIEMPHIHLLHHVYNPPHYYSKHSRHCSRLPPLLPHNCKKSKPHSSNHHHRCHP